MQKKVTFAKTAKTRKTVFVPIIRCPLFFTVRHGAHKENVYVFFGPLTFYIHDIILRTKVAKGS